MKKKPREITENQLIGGKPFEKPVRNLIAED